MMATSREKHFVTLFKLQASCFFQRMLLLFERTTNMVICWPFSQKMYKVSLSRKITNSYCYQWQNAVSSKTYTCHHESDSLSTLRDVPDAVSGNTGSSIPQNERYQQLEEVHNTLSRCFRTIDTRRYKLMHGLRAIPSGGKANGL